MAFPNPYVEAPGDTFSYSSDWFELCENSERGGSHFAEEVQEDTLVGLIPWNKCRSALRFFKGFSFADKSTPWALHRQQPHQHPTYPQLRCYDVSFQGYVPKFNPDNPNGQPFDFSVFTGDRRTKYDLAIATVRYHSFGQCKFWDDSDPRRVFEWQRNTVVNPPDVLLQALTVSGGLSQLVFAEGTGAALQPLAGTTRYTAPLAERQVQLAYKMLWMNVPWDYLSKNEQFFKPQKLLDGLARVNQNDYFSDGTEIMEAETLFLGGMQFNTFPSWVPSDDPTVPLMMANVLFFFHFFDPPRGATIPFKKGWNNMPWSGNGDLSGDGNYYYCTRSGALPPAGKPFLATYDYDKLFQHVRL